VILLSYDKKYNRYFANIKIISLHNQILKLPIT